MSKIKNALATGTYLADMNEKQIDCIAETIFNLFEVLCNTDPDATLTVLNQLNEQINEEDLKTMAKEHENYIKKLEDAIVLPEEELE